MDARDARELLESAMPDEPGTLWADFGAGEGTFTRELVELLGPTGRVFAVDRDAGSLAAVDGWPERLRERVTRVVADVSRPFDLPTSLDGALIANALHYFRDPAVILASLAARVKPGGRVVIMEYDRRSRNPWVPYPIPLTELEAIVTDAGLSAPTITARRPSRYGGDLYVAACDRLR